MSASPMLADAVESMLATIFVSLGEVKRTYWAICRERLSIGIAIDLTSKIGDGSILVCVSERRGTLKFYCDLRHECMLLASKYFSSS
jgi:hypothetical protein